MIYLQCPQCGKQYQVRDEYAGCETPCSCGVVLVVPEAGEASAPPAEDLDQAPPPVHAIEEGTLLRETFGAQPLPPGHVLCPECRTALPEESVICVRCGYNLRTGRGRDSLAGGVARISLLTAPRVQRGLGFMHLATVLWAAAGLALLSRDLLSSARIEVGNAPATALAILVLLQGLLSMAAAGYCWALNYGRLTSILGGVVVLGIVQAGLAVGLLASSSRADLFAPLTKLASDLGLLMLLGYGWMLAGMLGRREAGQIAMRGAVGALVVLVAAVTVTMLASGVRVERTAAAVAGLLAVAVIEFVLLIPIALYLRGLWTQLRAGVARRG